MENKWYVGQPIVTIKNSKDGIIIKNKEYNIKGIINSFCACSHVLLDIGIASTANTSRCGRCRKEGFINNGILWKAEILFAPLDQDISELTDILKEPIKELIGK